MKQKPKLSFWQIWNMSFGFLGIQFGFALQNANASRILQTFGADVEQLSWFWIAAPLTGMIIQPIIGHYSDNTWTRLGRRRPYFLFGALFASIALLFMPNAQVLASILPPIYIGAGLLMIMDASINVSMEPFRALVADLLPGDQTTMGFSIQTFLIGVGAVIGSWLPYILAEWLGVAKVSPTGGVPNNVKFAFLIGAITFISAILWTVSKTKEYPPEEYTELSEESNETKKRSLGIVQIFRDFRNMPKTMKQLGVVQFFSWFALFSMWVYTTPSVAHHHFGIPISDTSSEQFNKAGNWVGILFGVYNFVAMFYALLLPKIAKLTSRKITHSISLSIGAIGMISMYFIKDPNWLIFSMICIGFAWASILAMPYAILAPSLPPKKMGIYMGIFNFFITFPQILNGIFGGMIVKRIYHSESIYALVFAGISFFIAAISVLLVQDKVEH
jgi:maltose/moltooligosaccharide transporter